MHVYCLVAPRHISQPSVVFHAWTLEAIDNKRWQVLGEAMEVGV